jgi:hypothetical protein
VTRTTTTQLISEQSPNSNSRKKAYFESKYGTKKVLGRSSSAFFKEINAFKRRLRPEKTASSKKRKAESILSPLY